MMDFDSAMNVLLEHNFTYLHDAVLESPNKEEVAEPVIEFARTLLRNLDENSNLRQDRASLEKILDGKLKILNVIIPE